MNNIEVSVIIVCRNEERYLPDCIRSVRKQFVGNKDWELIIVDGMSEDSTRTRAIEMLEGSGVNYCILDNPGQTLASGWNIGISKAIGEFIIRPDAHAELQEGYITGALQDLSRFPEAGAAGGKLETRARTTIGKVISEALSMRTGVGNSSFRTGADSGYMDTVVYGLYRREVFQKAGHFNEALVRHQDTEFHHRVIKSGFKLYFDNRLTAIYYCRESVSAIMKQMYLIGYYFSSLIEHDSGTSLRPRHLAPMLFWSVLIVLFVSGFWIPYAHLGFVVLIFVYLTVIMAESVMRLAAHGRSSAILAAMIVPLIHLAYASGTFTGMIKFLFRKS